METVHTPTLRRIDEEIINEAIDSMIRLPAFILREISHDATGALGEGLEPHRFIKPRNGNYR